MVAGAENCENETQLTALLGMVASIVYVEKLSAQDDIQSETKTEEHTRNILITNARCDKHGVIVISIFSSHTDSCDGTLNISIGKKGELELVTYQRYGHIGELEHGKYTLKSFTIIRK